jgi:hypothetical protein
VEVAPAGEEEEIHRPIVKNGVFFFSFAVSSNHSLLPSVVPSAKAW